MTLSLRGEEWAKLGPTLTIWKVVQDLWDPQTNPDGYVSLGVAENSLMHTELVEYINKNITVSAKGLTYGDGGTGSRELRTAMARFLTKTFNAVVPIEASHVCIINGVSCGIEHLACILGDPGDAILLGQPYYGSFIWDIEHRPGVDVVGVAFDQVDPLSLEAVSAYEATIKACHAKGQKVAGLMLCNPHNPLGRCYPRQFIVELMRLCQRYRVHLISDEVYALSVFRTSDPLDESVVPFTSLASIPTDGLIDPSLTHVLWGLSKDFGANGLRLGGIISQHNPDFHQAVVPVALYSYPSSLSDSIATKLLLDDEFTDWYVRENQKRLKSSYEVVVAWAERYGIEYAKGVNTAFFLWVNLGEIHRKSVGEGNISQGQSELQPESDVNIDEATNKILLDNKIFLASGVAFGSERSGWFRIVFSQHKEILEEGLRRIEKALQLEDRKVGLRGVGKLPPASKLKSRL